MKPTKLAVAVLTVLALFFGWLIFRPGAKELKAPTRPEPQPTTEPTQTTVPATPKELTFEENGNLVFDENKWYLLYEEPGAPALGLELKISADSKCDLGEAAEGCDLKRVRSGAQVTVSGMRTGNALEVTELRLKTE